jgi:integrase/recombinase XerC
MSYEIVLAQQSRFTNPQNRKAQATIAIEKKDIKGLCLLLEQYLFIKSRKKTSISQRTVLRYQNGFRRFFEWTEKHGFHLMQVTEDILEQFTAYLSVRHSEEPRTIYGRNSIDVIVISVKTFYKALLWAKVISTDPSLEMRSPDVARNTKRPYFQGQEIKTIQSALPHQNVGIAARDAAIVELGLSTMLRANEILELNISDVDRSNRRVMVSGKGGKKRTVPLTSKPLAAIEKWLEYRHEFLGDRKHDALFLSASNRNAGGRLKYAGVYSIFKRLAQGIEMQQGRSMGGLHTLRRSGATRFYRKNKDLLLLGETLGHSSLETTKHYVRLDDSALRAALEDVEDS